MYYLVAFLALVGSDCISLTLFTTLENEEGELIEEGYFNSCYYQDQDQDQDQDQHLHQGKPSKCLLITYHYLSCMVLLLKFYKNLITKTIYEVAITTTINL